MMEPACEKLSVVQCAGTTSPLALMVDAVAVVDVVGVSAAGVGVVPLGAG